MPGTGSFSDEAIWNLAADWACTQQITSIPSWIHHHTRFGNVATMIEWTKNKGLYVSHAEAIAAWKSYDSCQIWIFSLIAKARTYRLWNLSAPDIDSFNRWQGHQWCYTAVDTCSSNHAVITVQSVDSAHILVALEVNLCYVFSFLDSLRSFNSVPFITSITQNWAESQGTQLAFPASYLLHTSDIVDF